MTAKDDAIAATGNRFSAAWLVHDAVETVDQEIAAAIADFKKDTRPLDMATLKLLDTHVVTLEKLGIQTKLNAKMIDIMVQSEIGDREVADKRAHERKIARIYARGPMWAAVVSILGALVGYVIGRVS